MRRTSSHCSWIPAALALLLSAGPAAAQAARTSTPAAGDRQPSRGAPNPVDPSLLGGLEWREIGPAVHSARMSDVAGVPGDRDILYAAAASSGLWKSTNGGITFEPVFENATTLSIGAIALEPGNPDVVWVGTGEGAVRNSISYGDGIYRTTDGGATWQHLGLRETERFSRIVVHPTNPRVVYAAAMGRAFGPNQERGIYRTRDGGATWQRVLFTNETSGASDVAIDPLNPDILYAGMYDHLRKPWHFRGGGPGSGLYRSADGGDTWTKLTDPSLDNGLPGAQLIGRSGISIHAANPNVVYALIESQEPGELWRSDDRGITWRMVSDERRLNNRPFYYTQVRADPVDPDLVYTLAGSFSMSEDGGRTWRSHDGSMFGDHHALWIDPTEPTRLLSGTDGGFWISNDRGDNWDFMNDMPIAQAYHVGVDMAEPYNILAGFQDHEIWRGPNEKWNRVGVRDGDWVRLRYMADGMYAIADPRDPNIVIYNGHFGDITKIDMRNADERYIQPYPPGPNGGPAALEEYRFNWNSPVLMSPSNPDVLYYGGNVVFKSTDQGETWRVISPDLTTDDPAKQQISGGDVTIDNTRAEFHTTILSLSESPVDPDVLWAGTDDGNLQVTRDGGASWTNVAPNIAGAPQHSWFASVKASNRDAGTAYVAIDQHRLDDFGSHAFVTHDYGATWTRISDGLRSYVHVVLEDLKQPNLLYAGTETGVFASFDRGATWTDLRLGLPPIPVWDMVQHPRDNDLILGTHGRGFYILDDVTPLQQLAAARPERVTLFAPTPPIRYIDAADVSSLGNGVYTAPNQPYGAILSYWVPAAGAPPIAIEISDDRGRRLATIDAPSTPGMNRVVWDLSEASSCGSAAGRGTWVRAIPGTYTVRLSAGGQLLEQRVEVRQDPNVNVGDAEAREWLTAARKIESMECSARAAQSRVRDIDAALQALAGDDVAAAIRAEAAEVSRALRPAFLAFAGDPRDPGHLNLPGRINWLTIQVGNNAQRPTAAQAEWIDRFSAQVEEHSALLDQVIAEPLAELNRRLRAAGMAEIGA